MFVGTVISIFPTPSLEHTAPIMKRIKEKDSILRVSDDPSLLVQSLLDLGTFSGFQGTGPTTYNFHLRSCRSHSPGHGRISTED